ncbi:U3 small nucleolar ribonucleoprotein protein IMP4-like [Homarus americanus]|uniref:U3 small nucleolar ribonucleoprotein protein IMP4-like n=1 Tax=Homarus americanus TaxID=6706 RepID=UPI001C468543|nr:U3 small nucleolar ribonucleoprotein protein IMP4-like [Homarus americanus]
MSEFSLRRQARLRREYLYRKSIEDRHATMQQRKEKIKESLREGKEIPTTLQSKALKLMADGDWDDPGPQLAVELGGEAAGGSTNVDDEYRWAGIDDPKVVVTTSRDPSSKLKQFAKEIKILFPNSQRINRGNYESKQLIDACRANEVTDFVVLHETRGNPDGLVISHLPNGPTAYFTLADVVMRHDIPNIGTMSEQYPHLIFHNFKSKLGTRTLNILKYLFPVPKDDSQRIVSFTNWDDWILFRQHTFKKVDGGKDYDLKEIGPRFSMKLFRIIMGTIEQARAADTEFVLRPYMNTARKRRLLSDDDPW